MSDTDSTFTSHSNDGIDDSTNKAGIEPQESSDDVKKIKKKLAEQMSNVNPALPDSQHRFTDVLANIGLYKDDPQSFVQLHHDMYRWVWQHEKVLMEDGDAFCVGKYKEETMNDTGEESEWLVPEGSRLMLQLKAGDRWWDWVYVKKSTLITSNLGLFAGRDFPRGSVIGYQIGMTQQCTKQNNTSDKQKTANKNNSCQSVMVERSQKYGHTVASTSQQEEKGHYLYMGMHYMNSACQYVKVGIKKYERGKRCDNCTITNNGTVQTIKKIVKNVELLAGYDRTKNGGNGLTKSSKKASRSKRIRTECEANESHKNSSTKNNKQLVI
jgi:hypothetical protein